MLKAIGAAPKFDNATEYSFPWYKQEISYLLDTLGQWDLTDSFEIGMAVSTYVHAALREKKPDLFIFYDHGNENHLIGNNHQSLMNASNLHLLKNCSVYTMCCLAAKVLGVKAIHQGTLEWWGYTENYTFTYDAIKEHGDISGYGLRTAHIKGLALKNVVEEARQYFYDKADELRANGKTIAAAVIVRNAQALVCWHSGNVPDLPEEKGIIEQIIAWIKWLLSLIGL